MNLVFTNLLRPREELQRPMECKENVMTTTFLIMRLIMAVGLIAFARLLYYVGELIEKKPSRQGASMLHANSELNPSASRAN
jgi:hypothetical protein